MKIAAVKADLPAVDSRDIDRARGGALFNLAGAAFGGGLTLLNEILAARFLDVSFYGLFALGMLLAKVGEVVSMFGLRMAVLHFIPLYREQGDRRRLLDTVIGALCFPLCSGIVFAAIVWWLAPWLAGTIFNEAAAVDFIRLLVWAVPAMALTEVIGHMTRGFGFVRYYVLVRNVVPPLSFAVLIVCLMWSGAEPYAIGIAYNLAYFLAMLAALISVRLVTGGGLWRLGLRLKCGQLYAYAFPVFINTLLYMIVGWTDIFVVGLFLDAAEIGRYRACMQLVVVFDLIAVALGSAIIHRYAVLEEQGRVAEAAVLYRHNIRWVVALAAPLSVIIFAHAVPILGMMGTGFVAAKPVLILLTLAYMIKSIGTSPGMALVVTRRQGVETRIAALVAGINLALNFLLVPEFGAGGAAFATVISFVCLTLMRAYAARRYARLEYPYAMAMRLIVAFLVPGCLVFWWLPRLFEIGALFHTLLLLTVLSVFAWRFALNGDERKWLAGTLWRISR